MTNYREEMQVKKYSIMLIALPVLLCACGRQVEVAEVSPQTTEASAAVTSETAATTEAAAMTEATTSEKMTETSETVPPTSPAETTIPESTEDAGMTDAEIYAVIEYVCEEGWIPYSKEPCIIFDGTDYITYDNDIAFYMDGVSKLPDSTLGQIESEQDLIAKAREVFIARLGQDFIDRAEAEYVERDGERVAIAARTTPVYKVQYYDKYDVWYIRPCMPSGTTADGKDFVTLLDNPPFLIVNGSDGKIIGCRF